MLALIVLALRRRPSPRRRAQRLDRAAAILALQLLVGALNVWLDEYEALIVLHLALGTLLWGTLVGLTFQLYRVPKPVESRPARPAARR